MTQNELHAFIDQLLQEALQQGIEAAEVYCRGGSAFSASAMDQEITAYEVSSSCGLSLRGTVNGKMGYASTQALDAESIRQLIEGVKESAALTEEEEQDELYGGDAVYPELINTADDLAEISPEAKLQACLQMTQSAKAADPRVDKAEAEVSTNRGYILLKNSLGLDLYNEQALWVAACMPIVKEGKDTATGMKLAWGRQFATATPEQYGRESTEDALSQLHASPVPAGSYRVIIRNTAMASLLTVFSGIFSAENAQQGLSLLQGREGEKIASEAVTLMDDPLLADGLASTPFDAEGSATRTKAVIDHGTLTTLLHSRKTAKKAGCQTTGNGFRAGYSAPVHVAQTNFYLAPGELSLEALTEALGDGLVITEVSGLHAGANPLSGDFSLLSKGYTVKEGKRERPVEQITVAGNFYTLLQQIQAVGSDLAFNGSPVGSPSVDAGSMKISG